MLPPVSLNSIVSGTLPLPNIPLEKHKCVIGTSVIEGMKSGIIYGIAFSLDGMIDKIRCEIDEDVRVEATGGLALSIACLCKSLFHIILRQSIIVIRISLYYYSGQVTKRRFLRRRFLRKDLNFMYENITELADGDSSSFAKRRELKVNERLFALRTRIGMTRKELAEKTGLKVSTLTDYEEGKIEPDIDTVAIISNTLGVSLNLILLGKEPKEKTEDEIISD